MKAIILFLWITGCIGEGCPIEKYDIEIFSPDEMPRCETKVDVWRSIHRNNEGICLRFEVTKDGEIRWPNRLN